MIYRIKFESSNPFSNVVNNVAHQTVLCFGGDFRHSPFNFSPSYFELLDLADINTIIHDHIMLICIGYSGLSVTCHRFNVYMSI